MVNILCPAYPNELPADYAERLGQHYSRSVSSIHKKNNGQFFTPVSMARLMASMSTISGKNLRVLDPGCGVGILSCALVEFINKSRDVEFIDIVLYETDKDLIFYTECALNYLKKWLSDIGNILLDYSINTQDFVIDNNFTYQNFEQSYFQLNNLFDIVISNPPYFKLKAADKRVLIAEYILGKQPNIYSIFISVATTLLREDGELIFVIPRSFTSGYYYTKFREFLIEKLKLDYIHIFSSRRFPFQVDNVLQETIIMKASRYNRVGNLNHLVKISSSIGLNDIDIAIEKEISINKIIKLDSSQKIIHLPTSEQEENIISIFDSWNQTLADYKISVSTGPVVDFRSLDFLRSEETTSTVPLFWLTNVRKMALHWPLSAEKNIKTRPQFIVNNEFSNSRLIKKQNCILLRRFSSKDDVSRIIAAPLFQHDIEDYTHIGVENHLNYIYKKDGAFSSEEMFGISVLLNSYFFDIYFRTFNGNINVSSTELRNIPMPPYQIILEIGSRFIKHAVKDQLSIDNIIVEIFNLPAK